MIQKTLEINRKTGKYEGKGAVPFNNQAAVVARELSEAMTTRAVGANQERPFRRFTVKFVSGHRYIADVDKSYFLHHGTDFDDPAAIKKLVDSKLPDSEIFRRAIRDFSKQIPIVYERWFVNKEGTLSIAGHVAVPKAESAYDKRLIPKELFEQILSS